MSELINTSRGKFAYRSYGNSHNPPLMLVHGWPQSNYCWKEIAHYLPDFYIITPDLRGLGDSPRSLDIKDYHKDQMGLDLFSLADELALDKFYLGGHDWGSAIAQEMTLIQPQRIEKLILINMIIINNWVGKKRAGQTLAKQMHRSSWYQHFLSIPNLPEQMIQGKEDEWVRFFNRGISRAIPEKAMQEYIRCYKIPKTITTAANLYRSIPADRKRWKNYLNRKIKIPSHLIHGRLDPVVIEDFLHGVHTAFQYPVEITYLEGGHFICDEKPLEVAKAIELFLSNQ